MDRITRLRIRNVRVFEDVSIDLADPVTVLVGENGSGKSTVLECLVLLRAAAEGRFSDALHAVHGGRFLLLRAGASEIGLGVRVEGPGEGGGAVVLDYELVVRFSPGSPHAHVAEEHLWLRGADEPVAVLARTGGQGRVLRADGGGSDPMPHVPPAEAALPVVQYPHSSPHLRRVLAVLRGIDVHLPFDTLPAWVGRTVGRDIPLRTPATLRPTDRLGLLGHGLANAWFALRNERDDAQWRHTLALVRLGLGERVEDVLTRADPSGGAVGLFVRVRGLAEPLPVAALSDGELSWLAFVALARLDPGRTLLAVDEPELHLHPGLLGRVLHLLAAAQEGGAPVLFATHSDRLLALLEDPAAAVRVLEARDGRAVVRRLDPDALERWIARYGDLGALRAAGWLDRVLAAEEE